AVGEPEVVELVVAEGVADAVEVLGGVEGADVREDLARVLLAGGGELAGDLVGVFAGGHREHFLDLAAALDARAPVDAARVEADQVVAAAEAGEGLPGTSQRVDAGPSGPAEVEHERADPVAGGLDPDEREVDGLAVRLVVVERHGEGAAFEGGVG